MNKATLAIVNPAAGFGKCATLLGPALDRLHRAGVRFEVAETKHAGHGAALTKEAYAAGYRRFLAVGGDGTSFEIVNGLFPQAHDEGEIPTLGFLPLGTGNSFLKDFTNEGVEYSAQAIIAGRTRPCDVIRINHRDGAVHYINILSLGFVSEVCVLANRRFKWLGAASYGLAVVLCLARFNKQIYRLKLDGTEQPNPPATALLIFCNSKYTGGHMMLAPNADIADGKIEIVRWSADRFDFIFNFKKCYDGSHIRHPLIWQGRAKRIELNFDQPIDVMVDGEVLTLQMDSLEVLPSALRVMV
ncbi:MAG: diacylglycerol kinase family lipid kinase [Acidobacteria bacterium]|nr:diacylglycerol kinase family lipid kinase [Acidobacteriota bacterium]MBI3421443.1 diacylglycerol kinase family lipid kinase [Acidobacteriota bacterium]